MDTDILFVLHILAYCMKVFKHLQEEILMYYVRYTDS